MQVLLGLVFRASYDAALRIVYRQIWRRGSSMSVVSRERRKLLRERLSDAMALSRLVHELSHNGAGNESILMIDHVVGQRGRIALTAVLDARACWLMNTFVTAFLKAVTILVRMKLLLLLANLRHPRRRVDYHAICMRIIAVIFIFNIVTRKQLRLLRLNA